MKDSGLRPETGILESSTDEEARAYLEEQLRNHQFELSQLSRDATPADVAKVKVDIANAQLGLEQNENAWNEAKAAFDIFISNEDWASAIEACDIMYQTEQPASIQALVHGVWLSVTYPVDPEYTIGMLSYIIDETPNDSDGAAVAAATAHYIVGVRASDEKHDSLSFLTKNMITKVAQRHSDVNSQDKLDFWMEKMNLTEPEKFLPMMSTVIDAIANGQWWIDRDALRDKLPLN
ncbi:MAG: hypothetical protein DIZ80_08740 [endosymbiont of Galathealinum brachiosum]|uniref:Uncharacterized protein n=1 Tax=endosymbiont of Galathealinum brachiosum TaxID=2200906 RepID=A0A370DBT6_9GAMM|nr:MAG: hypothetical protein DIZ80_08740 [endosymbiont of Galathealinum brachiosum]